MGLGILALALMCAGLALIVAGVNVLFGAGWALIAGGLACAALARIIATGAARG